MKDGESAEDEQAQGEKKKKVLEHETCDEDELIIYNQKRPCYFNPHGKFCCVGCWNLRRFAVSNGINEIISSSIDGLGYVYNFIVGAHKKSDALADEYRPTVYITFVLIITFHFAAGIIIIVGAIKRMRLLCLVHCVLLSCIIILYAVFIGVILQNSKIILMRVIKEEDSQIGHESASYYYDLTMKLYCGWCGVKMLFFLYDIIISLSLFTLFRAGIMFDGLPICGSYFAKCGKDGFRIYVKQLCAHGLRKNSKTKTMEEDQAESLPPPYELEASTSTSKN